MLCPFSIHLTPVSKVEIVVDISPSFVESGIMSSFNKLMSEQSSFNLVNVKYFVGLTIPSIVKL